MSQLTLALEAEISSKHLSFVETGRSQPSRAMVLRLATALDLPLRERNPLLAAAGYAPMFRARGFQTSDMHYVHRAIDFLLRQQEPYPALVVDRLWNIVRQNEPSRCLLLALLGSDAAEVLVGAGSPNLLRLALSDPLRARIENWDEVARTLLTRFRREVRSGRDEALTGLRDELLRVPGIPDRWASLELEVEAPPVLPIIFRVGDVRLSLFTTLSTFGTPQDVGLQELRIESYFPLDDVTERYFVDLSARGDPASVEPAG